MQDGKQTYAVGCVRFGTQLLPPFGEPTTSHSCTNVVVQCQTLDVQPVWYVHGDWDGNGSSDYLSMFIHLEFGQDITRWGTRPSAPLQYWAH